MRNGVEQKEVGREGGRRERNRHGEREREGGMERGTEGGREARERGTDIGREREGSSEGWRGTER